MDIVLRVDSLNNRQDPIRLGRIGDFRDPAIKVVTLAENVDVSTDGEVTRRQGRARIFDGAAHSLWVHPQDDTLAFFVASRILRILNTDYSSDPLATLANDNPMAFESVNGEVVGTNGGQIGWVSAAGGFAEFAPTLDQFEAVMPPGQYLAFLKGILYVAAGPHVFASKPYNVERRDTRFGQFPMGGHLRMLAPVEDGLYVATEKRVGFISGGGIDDFTYRDLSNNVPPDGAFFAGWERVGDKIQRLVVWVSTEGFCLGRSGGMVELLSANVALPTGTSGRVFSRTLNGIPQYIAVINNAQGAEAFVAPTLTVTTINV